MFVEHLQRSTLRYGETIEIVLDILLSNSKHSFEIYDIINLPVPSYLNTTKTEVTVSTKYNIETGAFMIANETMFYEKIFTVWGFRNAKWMICHQ